MYYSFLLFIYQYDFLRFNSSQTLKKYFSTKSLHRLITIIHYLHMQIMFIRTIQVFFSESSDSIPSFLIEMPYPFEMIYHPIVSP